MINLMAMMGSISDTASDFITMIVDSKPYTITAQSESWGKAKLLFASGRYEELYNLINPSTKVQKFFCEYDDVVVKDGLVYYKGEAVHGCLVDRILRMIEDGENPLPFVKFLARLQQNPSKNSVDELYNFISHRGLPITSNGCFLAYKAVRNDFKDVYSNTYSNNVGQENSMPRNKVDDNSDIECSTGFHVGTLEYARNYMPNNGHIVIVEVDPANVVSVPKGVDFQKCRVCAYKVVSVYDQNTILPKEVYPTKYEEAGDIPVNSIQKAVARIYPQSENRLTVPADLICGVFKSDDSRDVSCTSQGKDILLYVGYEDDGSVVIRRGDQYSYTHHASLGKNFRFRIPKSISVHKAYDVFADYSSQKIIVSPAK